MALKNFTQFTPQTLLSATDYVVGYRDLDEIRTDLDSLTNAISGLLITKGFTPGGSLGSVRRISFRYTIGSSSPVNAVSGLDDFSRTLSYTPSQIEVYRNGSHLIESLDFLATNSTQVTNLSTLNVGDIVEVVALSATGVTVIETLTGSGVIVQSNYRYTVPTSLANGAVTITGPDDFGSTLRYAAPNLAVYLNGSHLVNSYDYTSTDGLNITLNEPVATGDVVDVQTLSSVGTGAVYGLSAFSGVSQLNAQKGVKANASTGIITVSADIVGLSTKASPAAGDQVMLFDVAGNDNRKTTVSTLTSLAIAGSAPQLAQAWVNWNGYPQTSPGTYSRTGNTVTVTVNLHRLSAGMIADLNYTSGAANDGAYVVTNATTNTFQVTDPSSGTTSGNVTLNFYIRESYNVSSISYSTPIWRVNFATPFTKTSYAVVCNSSSALAGNYQPANTSIYCDAANGAVDKDETGVKIVLGTGNSPSATISSEQCIAVFGS